MAKKVEGYIKLQLVKQHQRHQLVRLLDSMV